MAVGSHTFTRRGVSLAHMTTTHRIFRRRTVFGGFAGFAWVGVRYTLAFSVPQGLRDKESQWNDPCAADIGDMHECNSL